MDLTELLEVAEKERQSRPPVEIRCCVAAGCVSAQSEAVLGALRGHAARPALADRVKVYAVGCLRLCSQGPLVQVAPDGPLYQKVTPDSAGSIVASVDGGRATAEPLDPAAPFFAQQAS